MSGLLGIVRFHGAPVDRLELERLAAAAPHRGPLVDWIEGGVGLAVQRRAPEPTLAADPHCVATANARIDNQSEVVELLRRAGFPIDPSTGAAELLSSAYRSWGASCAARLVGDFALALWDRRRRRLLAWRDPMGMRPLYYRTSGDGVAFASEIAQLLALPDQPARIREPAVLAYVAGDFDDLDHTFYEGIEQLPPGRVLMVDASGVAIRRFWEIDPDRVLEDIGDEACAELFLESFSEAVRCRMAGDRPVGVLLSGGMDSMSVASVAGRSLHDPSRLHAYSFAFERLTQCDERQVSRHVVEAFGLPATDIAADDLWPLNDYPQHGPHRDEPYIGAFQPLLETALAAAAADGMAAMISGDRGDLLVGDQVYDPTGLARDRHLARLLRELRAQSRARGRSLSRVAFNQLVRPALSSAWPEAALPGLRSRLSSGFERLGPTPPPWLVSGAFGAHGPAHRATNRLRGRARRRRHALIFAPMHQRGVVWSERTNARHGLGFVDVWSDRRLAELILAMPQYRVQTWSRPKGLVRTAMVGVMPDAALRGAAKVDPGPLYDMALQETAVATVRHLLSDMRAHAAGWLDGRILSEAYEAHLAGADLAPEFWWALTLEMWLREYFA